MPACPPTDTAKIGLGLRFTVKLAENMTMEIIAVCSRSNQELLAKTIPRLKQLRYLLLIHSVFRRPDSAHPIYNQLAVTKKFYPASVTRIRLPNNTRKTTWRAWKNSFAR